MAENLLNCWERKECGYGPGGKNVSGLGQCPASLPADPDSSLAQSDGINGGLHFGRLCWLIERTLCGGLCRSIREKMLACVKCPHYAEVNGCGSEDVEPA